MLCIAWSHILSNLQDWKLCWLGKNVGQFVVNFAKNHSSLVMERRRQYKMHVTHFVRLVVNLPLSFRWKSGAVFLHSGTYGFAGFIHYCYDSNLQLSWWVSFVLFFFLDFHYSQLASVQTTNLCLNYFELEAFKIGEGLKEGAIMNCANQQGQIEHFLRPENHLPWWLTCGYDVLLSVVCNSILGHKGWSLIITEMQTNVHVFWIWCTVTI